MASKTTNAAIMRLGMRVFGLPYQFPAEVDPRFSDVSSNVGRSYLNNIRLQAPILTMIPGNPYYLPGEDKSMRVSMGEQIVNGSNDDFKWLKTAATNSDDLAKGDTVRYYDFTPAFQDYIQYVNIMLRTIAGFLELEETLDGVSLQQYNWTYYKDNETGSADLNNATKTMQSDAKKVMQNNYRYYTKTEKKTYKDNKGKTKTKKVEVTHERKNYELTDNQVLYQTETAVKTTTKKSKKYGGYLTSTTKAVKDKVIDMASALYETVTNMQYVRFCVDPSSGFQETYNNETGTSLLKSAFDNGQDMFKEVAFIVNSGGSGEYGDDLASLVDAATESLSTALDGNNVTSILSRILNLTGNVVKGNNVIMPDIYKSSSRPMQYSFTVHLKAPYGNKFGIYMDNLVPLMHLICLAIPKQTTANTYGSPFLVKAYMDGVCNINLGMITDMSVNKSVSEQSWTVDGMPNEIDVQFTITDLYSDLTMSPQENPVLFLQNTSLIEYLSNTCGMSLVTPQISTKIKTAINTIKNRFTDVPQNVYNVFQENISSAIRAATGF